MQKKKQGLRFGVAYLVQSSVQPVLFFCEGGDLSQVVALSDFHLVNMVLKFPDLRQGDFDVLALERVVGAGEVPQLPRVLLEHSPLPIAALGITARGIKGTSLVTNSQKQLRSVYLFVIALISAVIWKNDSLFFGFFELRPDSESL